MVEATATAVEPAEAIRQRQLPSVELLDLYLDRIARLGPPVNALVTLDADRARTAARRALAAVARRSIALAPLTGGRSRRGIPSGRERDNRCPWLMSPRISIGWRKVQTPLIQRASATAVHGAKRPSARPEPPRWGPLPLASFRLDRNRIIGRCQGTQLKLPTPDLELGRSPARRGDRSP